MAKGFTLIELMIVISITSILSLIGINQYMDYLAKAQIMEAINVMGGMKQPVAEFYGNNGRFPTQEEIAELSPLITPGNIEGNLTKSTKYLDNILVGGGGNFWVIILQFKHDNISSKLFYKTIGFSTPGIGKPDAGTKWNCFAATIQRNLLPSFCQAYDVY